MSYIKAADVLPHEIIETIQGYIDGEYIYIPRKEANRKSWGDNTDSRKLISYRNADIYEKYRNGISVNELTGLFYLSPKSIQKIIAKIKLNKE